MEIISTLEKRRVPITVMQIIGNIDSATYPAFQAHADDLISKGATYILVDLEKAPFISSAGLRAVHSIFNQLRSFHKDVNDDLLRKSMSTGTYKSPYLKVVNLSKEAREVFELGGFDTYIEVHDDMQKGLNSFQ